MYSSAFVNPTYIKWVNFGYSLKFSGSGLWPYLFCCCHQKDQLVNFVLNHRRLILDSEIKNATYLFSNWIAFPCRGKAALGTDTESGRVQKVRWMKDKTKIIRIYWFIATSRERRGYPSTKTFAASLTRALSSSTVSSYSIFVIINWNQNYVSEEEAYLWVLCSDEAENNYFV